MQRVRCNRQYKREHNLVKSQILVEIARKNDEKAEGYWYYLEHFEEVFRAIYTKYGVSLLQSSLLTPRNHFWAE